MIRCLICASRKYVILEDHVTAWFDCCLYARSLLPANPHLYGPKYKQEYLKRASSKEGKELLARRVALVEKEIVPLTSILIDVGSGISIFEKSFTLQKVLSYEPYLDREHSLASVYKSSRDESKGLLFFDSFEHIERPCDFLLIFRPVAVLITIPILPPSVVSDPSLILRFKHYKPEEHIHYFTSVALRKLFSALSYSYAELGPEEGRLAVEHFKFIRG